MIEAVRVNLNTGSAAYDPDHLYDPASLSEDLRIRNWHPGDRFWPAHTKSAKKIKELLMDRHITGAPRKVWPVLVSGDRILWVRGFPAPATLRAQASGEAILIRESPLGQD